MSTNNRPRNPQTFTGESLTQQHMKSEADINTIVGRYMKTGQLGNPVSNKQPIYGDFSSIDYMEMRNAIADIDQEFGALPSRIRSRFQNDAHQLIRFIEKPENYQEAVKLGLLPAPVPQPDAETPVGTPTELTIPNPA